MDVYIRFSNDPFKDYCFSVPANRLVKELDEIFRNLAVIASPSYFYDPVPEGYSVSTHPGYLTAEGSLLFCWHADDEQFLKPLQGCVPISSVLMEGQLIVPRWRFNTRRQLKVLAFLLAWLYLDLPEKFTPTPEIMPSKVLTRIALQIPIICEYVPDFTPLNSPTWQIIFFGFHLIKVCLIYLILRIGYWNVYSLNPFKENRRYAEIVASLKKGRTDIGWTGVKRLLAEEWPSKYHDLQIEKYGGVVQAMKAGAFEKSAGIFLKPGEGWNNVNSEMSSNRSANSVADLLLDGVFVVSANYLDSYSAPLARELAVIKDRRDRKERLAVFRRYGYSEGPPLLKNLFDYISAERVSN